MLTALLLIIVVVLIIYQIRRLKRPKKPTTCYVMCNLDLMNEDCTIRNYDLMEKWLKKLRNIHADGVMVDVWWGICEHEFGKYNFSGYKEFFELCKKYDLYVLPVLSFHKCGGNVGDTVTIELPKYLENYEDIFYVDHDGNVDNEYISIFADQKFINGTTPIGLYSNFMIAFRNEFKEEIESGLIRGIEVGLGPCGELRYPSYRSPLWNYPGTGALQCYDKNALEIIKQKDLTIPSFITDYNADPREVNGWTNIDDNTKAFFDFYNMELCEHADRILSEARRIFGEQVHLAAKIPGIHWWCAHPSRAAEACAGLWNYGIDNGYERIARSCAKFGVGLCFTCLEMANTEETMSHPPDLVREVLEICEIQNVPIEGENALETYSVADIERIIEWSPSIGRFTFLRLGEEMMKQKNITMIAYLIKKLHATLY